MTMRSSCNIHAGARKITASSRRPTIASRLAGSSRWSWTECRKEGPGIRDVRVRFTNGMELSQCEGDSSDLFGMVRKMLG